MKLTKLGYVFVSMNGNYAKIFGTGHSAPVYDFRLTPVIHDATVFENIDGRGFELSEEVLSKLLRETSPVKVSEHRAVIRTNWTLTIEPKN